ncbi:unnamed protein product [Prorocentrum cordatum]|uniref:Uncharacterized protein n=1 Tax=Prorocentrum cordatum TaxID=2364126 RepID=A0ABN9VAX1_9DINO|nr:unnamed protein product [Polarella glacialis]
MGGVACCSRTGAEQAAGQKRLCPGLKKADLQKLERGGTADSARLSSRSSSSVSSDSLAALEAQAKRLRTTIKRRSKVEGASCKNDDVDKILSHYNQVLLDVERQILELKGGPDSPDSVDTQCSTRAETPRPEQAAVPAKAVKAVAPAGPSAPVPGGGRLCRVASRNSASLLASMACALCAVPAPGA